MDKQADSALNQLVRSIWPFSATSDSYKVDLLPFNFFEDERTNKAVTNAIVAGGTTLLGVALLKALSHRVNAKKWEKVNKKIVEDKVNALYPITSPNYDADETMVNEVRKIGLNSLTKQASEDGNQDSGFSKQLRKGIELSFKGALPIIATLTAAAAAPSLVQNRLEDKDDEELEAKITAKRNELDALRAKIIDLQLSKKANGESDGRDAASTAAAIGSYGLAAILAALVPGAFMVANSYLKKHDRSKSIVDAGKDAASRNLTNIPQRLSLKLNAQGRPALNKSEQKYVGELKELANQAAIANIEEVRRLDAPKSTVDFDDKITKIEKDALFS